MAAAAERVMHHQEAVCLKHLAASKMRIKFALLCSARAQQSPA